MRMNIGLNKVLLFFFPLFVVILFLWKFPDGAAAFGIALLLCALLPSVYLIFKKQWETYCQGEISHSIFIRNVSLEILGLLLAMFLAGWAGRYLAQMVVIHIASNIIKIIVGIFVGIAVGAGVGLLVKKMWGRLVNF